MTDRPDAALRPALSRLLPLAAVLAVGAGWGLSVVAMKVSVSTGHHPVGLMFWQFAIFAVCLSAISALQRRPPPLHRRALLFYAGVALMGAFAPGAAELSAAVHLPAGVLAICIATVPMFSLALSVSLRIERPGRRRLMGVALGALAILLLLGPEASLPDPAAWPWVLVCLIAPFSYACEGLWIAARMPDDAGPIRALLGASLTGVCALAPAVALVPGVWVPMPGPWGDAEKSVLAAAVLSCVCYWGYLTAVRLWGPVYASLIAWAVTVMAVLWGVALLGERPSPFIWAALALMVGGMALAQPPKARP